jgi:hypothetical protein
METWPPFFRWDGSACAFPDALLIDYNEYPRYFWNHILGEVPAGYSLIHIFDHVLTGNEVNANLEHNKYLAGKGMYGLFTCSQNTVYVPSIFVQAIHANNLLRGLLVEKQAQLYQDVCANLPPLVEPSLPKAELRFALEDFTWAPLCTGSIQSFLSFRHLEMNRFFS